MQRIPSGGPFEQKAAYVRAVVTPDGYIHVAGCTGYDPEIGGYPPSVQEQCRLTLRTIETALAKAGAGFADVVRVTYMLPDRNEFEPCWPQLREAFGDNPPAATMIECGLLSKDMKIEIEVTAFLASFS